ncbi:MAG: hypothetical protein ACFB03_22990 [Paracoccaceae bacterium]
MSIVTDGLLIVTCLTAALYCVILSRRLAKFSDTKSGIGEQIGQLNAILEETRTTNRESQTSAKAITERLERDLASSRKLARDLSDLIERAESVIERASTLESAETKPVAHPPREVAAVHEEPDAPREPIAVEAPRPVEEEEFNSVSETDFDLSDARGEPQLGFLPNVVEDVAPSPESGDLKIALTEETEAVVVPSAPVSDKENLLKVERMAL